MIVQSRSKIKKIPTKIADFSRFKGSPECHGLNGIWNLFSIVKSDFKAVCRDYNIYFPKQANRLIELKPLMFQFNIHWDEWSNSNYCNLSSEEIQVVNLYRKKGDLFKVGEQLGLSYDLSLTYLSKAIRKLKTSQSTTLFQKWKDFKHLDSQKPDEFLDVPLEGLHHIFPNRVYFALQLFGKNMREVLEKVTLEELHKHRNFGIKAENELRAILKKYQCLRFLKK